MNKIIWLVFLLFVFFLAVTSQANAQIVSTESAKVDSLKLTLKPYASVGMAYGQPINIKLFPTEYKMSGSKGYDVRIGAEILPTLDIEAQYLNLGSFKNTQENITPQGNRYHTELNLAILAVMINANFKYPLEIKGMEIVPYGAIGVGRAQASIEWRVAVPSAGLSLSGKDDYSGPCYKLGIGVRAKISKNLYTYSEFIHFHASFSGQAGIKDKLNGTYSDNGFAIGLGWKY